jgi:hypothetical protein
MQNSTLSAAVTFTRAKRLFNLIDVSKIFVAWFIDIRYNNLPQKASVLQIFFPINFCIFTLQEYDFLV